MKTLLSIALAAAFALCGQAFAGDEPTPLTEEQMDEVTAGNLYLPNGNSVFDGFDNPAPGEFHPNFSRGAQGSESSGNEGPWSAHFNSDGVIVCTQCG